MTTFYWMLLIIGSMLNIAVFFGNRNIKNELSSTAPFYFSEHVYIYNLIDFVLFFMLLFFLLNSWYIVVIAYLATMIIGLILAQRKFRQFKNEV